MQLIPRHIRPQLLDALGEARVVCLLGARQTGKSTLVRDIAANELRAPYLTLDDPATLALASEDPTGFLAGTERLVIDEVQRAPDLLLSIKRVVDADPDPGRYLITGSANIVTHPRIADALPGRVDYMNLWPFSQTELDERQSAFLELVFAGDTPGAKEPPIGRRGYAERVARGGFPEIARSKADRRRRFFAGYVDSILGREIDELGSVRDVESTKRLLRLVAARSASLTNLSSLGRELAIDHKTVANRLRSLEQLFTIIRLPAWHANLGHRVVRSDKLYLADTGMLCSLIGADATRLENDGGVAGSAFETFAVAELVRLAATSSLGTQLSLHHYRDQRGNEVDVVMELANGDVVGIEVKATATPDSRATAGLRLLRDKLGNRFRQGLLLHLGPDLLRFGERLAAVPLAALWQAEAPRGR